MPEIYSVFDPNLGVPFTMQGYSPTATGRQATGAWTTEDYANAGLIDANTGGLTDNGMAAMNSGSYTNAPATNWAGVAGSIGTLGKSAADLYFNIQNRELQKQVFAQNQASLIANYKAGQLNSLATLGQTAEEADRQRALLAGTLASRGLSSSSIANEQGGYLNSQIANELARQQRQISLNTTNFNTQMALLKLQKEKASNDFMSSMLGEGMQGAGALAALALILI